MFASLSQLQHLLQTIFNSLVQPHFNYCCTVWDKCNKTQATKLQKLQNRASRVLTFSSYDANADPLFKRLGWNELDSQRNFYKAVMMYKSIKGLAPDYMCSMFRHRDTIASYSLRDAEGKNWLFQNPAQSISRTAFPIVVRSFGIVFR